MRRATLGEFVTFTNGGTPSRAEAGFWAGSIPWITGADITDDGAVAARSSISDAAVERSSTHVLPRGTVLLLTRTSVGKVGVLPEPMAINQDITGITPSSELDTQYLVQFLRASKPTLLKHLRGATIKGVTRDDVASLSLPLPPIAEQRRIAAILDQADALRSKRRRVLAQLDALPQAIFHTMFGNSSAGSEPLADLAFVTSGITKGRRTSDPTSPTPYLAVSNVQAGYLRLDSVKEIDATDAEKTRYALHEGDIVLTEGGDPDKLGRGTVWRAELPLCLHQNHIFRVRIEHHDRLLPEYFAALLAHPTARGYFLRSAKQTTGIASINMTQLKALPVLLPPVSDQHHYLWRTERVRRLRHVAEEQARNQGALFASLQSRAFRGEL